MPKRVRPFIDKKKSVTFHLVHRSQRDPLIAAEGNQLVLAPVDGIGNLSINEQPSSSSKNHANGVDEKTMQERIKYGIFFDDDYDYLRHLRDANEVYSLEEQTKEEPLEQRYRINKDGTMVNAGKDILPRKKIELPASLFESKGVELKTGLLNQAAPQSGPHPDLDPDIVAALDDDNFDFNDPENQLEDDFILKANCGSPNDEKTTSTRPFRPFKSESDDDDDDDENFNDDDDQWETDEDRDDFPAAKNMQISKDFEQWARDRKYYASNNAGRFDDDKEETKSRFTNYSLTSSVMRRSDGLKQVDAVFEKLYEQYDEEEIGALENDDDEITGFIKPESERIAQLIEEYERDLQKDKLTVEEMFKNKEIGVENLEENTNDTEELTKIFAEEKPKEKWDCESILSTYSTLYNHPTLISEPPSRKRARKSLDLNPKTGLPEGVFRAPTLGPILSRLNRQDENAMDTDDRKTMASSRTSIKRSRFETAQEKKARKMMVKAERKERRQEKKMNKLAFREEAIRLQKQDANVKQNLSGIKLV